MVREGLPMLKVPAQQISPLATREKKRKNAARLAASAYPVGDGKVAQAANAALELEAILLPVAREKGVLEEPPAPAQDGKAGQLLLQQALCALRGTREVGERQGRASAQSAVMMCCAFCRSVRRPAVHFFSCKPHRLTPRMLSLWATTQPRSQSMSLPWFASTTADSLPTRLSVSSESKRMSSVKPACHSTSHSSSDWGRGG